MLLKHGTIYLLARIVPGFVAFASLVTYTRILSPEDYGSYALVLAAVSLVHVNLFSWLELSLLRVLPSCLDNPRPLLATVLALYLALAAATGIAGGIAWLLLPDPVVRGLLLLGVPMLWVHAWMELNLKLCQSKLMPVRYGTLLFTRSVATLCIGVAMVLHGLGAYGPLAGFLIGTSLACVTTVIWEWRGIRPRIDARLAKELAHYGLPLTGAIALVFIMDASDRFLIAAYLDNEAVGAYSAAYDLASQSLQVLMMAVNLAAYPLAIRAYENEGMVAAITQVRQNGSLLLAIALPATVGMIVLSQDIVDALLGVQYRSTASLILPWIALAVFVAGLKVFFFDIAFQLRKRSGSMMWSVAAGALVNVSLNLWWIPSYGLIGSARATLVSYVVALLVCVALGRRLMPINFDWGQVLRVAGCCAAMALAVLALPPQTDVPGLVARIGVGVLVYGSCALITNVLGVRTCLVASLRRKRLQAS